MNNKLPQINLVFNRRKTASPTVKASVDIRVCHDYKQKFISTGVRLYSNQWKNGKIVNCPDIIQISQTLDRMLANVRQAIIDTMQEGSMDIMAIPDRIKNMDRRELTFIDFCRQRSAIRKYRGKRDTQKRYDRFLRLFGLWGGIRTFKDINDSNIVHYDKYLESTGMKPYSKWNNYHRFLNSFIIDAINEGHLTRNPYKWINIDRHKYSRSIERCLTPEEFSRIKTASLPTESIERVRDLFIFQTYTCLSYTDLREFDSSMITEIKGVKVYTGRRRKTYSPFTIPLLSPALEILNKYNGLLPIISNVKYNEYLKIVAQSSGIDKPISSHWARHTGATLLLNEGVPMQVVAKICGHSSTRITEQVYAKLLDETVVDAIRDVHI